MSTPPRLILFPGLGADARLFEAERRAFPHVETPDWLPPLPRESLRDYSKRWGEVLNLREPAVLAGLSMGGMVALEMARAHGAKCVGLIASCRCPAQVSWMLKASERASRIAPEWVLDRGRVLAPLFVGRGAMPQEGHELLVRMAREIPVPFLRWASRAIVEWEGCPDPGAPIYHIHGNRDWVIPVRTSGATTIVDRGAHVLSFSHPNETTAFLRGLLTMSQPRAE